MGALNKYGRAILGLEDAVAKTDWETLEKASRKFDLFSTAYRNAPYQRKQVEAILDKILGAIDEKNGSVIKEEYANLLQLTNIKTLLSRPNLGKKSYGILNVDAMSQ